MPPLGRAGVPFWAWFAVRAAAVFVAGLALIAVFRDWVVPVLRGDVARGQGEHYKAQEPPGR